jgi:uncharacterized protein (TIGR03083 family)
VLRLQGERIVLRDFLQHVRDSFLALESDEAMFTYMKFRVKRESAESVVLPWLLEEPDLEPRVTMWAMLDSSSISIVLQTYRPERDAFLKLLASLSADDWARTTECPVYSVKGIATHVLGDDLSLLSRQRDGAVQGLVYVADELPGADFRTLLDAFNDRWVATAQFMSPLLVIELLGLTGEWTAAYYESVDPDAPGESVGLFGASQDGSSPFWQAIAREYLERWIHHSQIRRALGLGSLADAPFLRTGIEVAAAMAQMEPVIPSDPEGIWGFGPIVLGQAQQAADILTLAHTSESIRQLVRGPADMVDFVAAVAGKR